MCTILNLPSKKRPRISSTIKKAQFSDLLHLTLASTSDWHSLLFPLVPTAHIIELPILLTHKSTIMQSCQDAGD